MDAFEKELKDRVANGKSDEWACHLCGREQSKKVQLKTDSLSRVWCNHCIEKSLKPKTIKYSKPLPGRNEPCYCGSEKKYKHCHLKTK